MTSTVLESTDTAVDTTARLAQDHVHQIRNVVDHALAEPVANFKNKQKWMLAMDEKLNAKFQLCNLVPKKASAWENTK